MRVMHLIETMGRSGAERMLVTTLRYLEKERFYSTVCYLYKADGERSLLGELHGMGIKVYSLNMKGVSLSIKALKRLVKIIKDEKIDVIHTHLFGANIYGRIAGKVAKVSNIVTTLHNPDYGPYFTFRNRFFFERRRLLDKFTGRFFNRKFISVSEAVKRSTEKFLGFKNIKVLHNSIDPDEFIPLAEEERLIARGKLGFSESDIVLVSVARLSLQKGHTFLLRALNDKRLKGPNIKLLLVGTGPLDSELREETKRLGLQDRVMFLGKRDDVREILGCSDIFALPSIYEGFGIALLEAMALKIPCIASDVDGIREIVTNGEGAIMVKPSSSHELASAIASLINNPIKRSDIARKGHTRVKRFDIKKQIKSLENVYLSL